MTAAELRRAAAELRREIRNAERVYLDTGRDGVIAATIGQWKDDLAQIKTEIASKRRRK